MLKKCRTNNENGMALVTCLLIMMALTMIGIGITTDSTIEIKIGGNFKDKAVSFQNADTGTASAPEIIEDNLDKPRSISPYTYSNNGVTPVITVNQATFSTIDETPDYNNPDITIEVPKITVADAVNKQKIETKIYISKVTQLAAGSAIQMAAGYEGKGKSAASGGAHAYYRCQSKDKQGGTTSNTEIYYRHVPY